MSNAQNAYLATKQNTKHCIILPNANNVKPKTKPQTLRWQRDCVGQMFFDQETRSLSNIERKSDFEKKKIGPKTFLGCRDRTPNTNWANDKWSRAGKAN
jgi:hypothetical protein